MTLYFLPNILSSISQRTAKSVFDLSLYVHNIVSDYIASSSTNLIETLDINPGFTDEITFFKNNEYRIHRLRWTSSFGKFINPLCVFTTMKKITTDEVVRKYKDLSFLKCILSLLVVIRIWSWLSLEKISFILLKIVLKKTNVLG